MRFSTKPFKVKLHGPDYQGVDVEQAERDFKTRIENYSKVYDPLCRKKDEKISFIKLIDVGQSYIVHRVQDHIQSRMVYFLMNIKGLIRNFSQSMLAGSIKSSPTISCFVIMVGKRRKGHTTTLKLSDDF